MERADSSVINNNNSSSNNQEQVSSNTFPSYCPPEQFGIVEPGIYRSNMFDSSNFGFLKTLQLKSVILLSFELPTREIMQFMEENKIKLWHIGALVHGKGFSGSGHHNGRRYHGSGTDTARNISSWRPISDEIVKETIEKMLDSAVHPVMICCTMGTHETGAVIGCLRKLMGWNLNSIVAEYRSFAGNRSRYIIEQFIELFDLDLITLPSMAKLPEWIAGTRLDDS